MGTKGWDQILRRCDEKSIIARSSRFALIIGILFAAPGLIAVCKGLNYLFHLYFSQGTLLLLPLGLAFFLFGYRISVPFLLNIDPAARAYRGYRGWFPFRQRFAGGLQDFERLSLKSSPGGGKDNDTWSVSLDWRAATTPGRQEPFLLYFAAGGADARAEAQRQALVFASLLNLLLVDEENKPITGAYQPKPAPLAVKIDPNLLDDYAGHYSLDVPVGLSLGFVVGFDVAREGDRLFIYKDKDKQELLAENETTFFTKDSELRTIFIRDADSGRVVKIKEGTAEFNRTN